MSKAKYIVRKNTQLTSLQEYVYCTTEETANAVRARYESEPGCEDRYNWTTGAPTAKKEHWCVVPDLAYAMARTSEVRMGQWYIGIWHNAADVQNVWWGIVQDESKIKNYRANINPIDDRGFVIVNAEDHANPVEMWCYRNRLKVGDCFEYLDEPGRPRVVVESGVHEARDAPRNWCISYMHNVSPGAGLRKVRLIRHWNAQQGPIILPCIDPLGCLDTMSSEGLTDRECLRRYEEAMQTEGMIGHRDGRQYVCLPSSKIGNVGGICSGLTPDQVELAKVAWSIKLEVLQKQQRQTDVEKERADMLPCDSNDELPNMAHVDAAP